MKYKAVTVEDRVRYARNAVASYARDHDSAEEPLETNIGDLLADLFHLCDAANLDFARLEARARMHHQTEVVEQREKEKESEAKNGK